MSICEDTSLIERLAIQVEMKGQVAKYKSARSYSGYSINGMLICCHGKHNSLGNECNIKENENNVFGNGNNKSENDREADGIDIRPIYDTDSLEQDDAKAKERVLLASLIENMKREINERKRMNKSLDASNKILDAYNKLLRTKLERYNNVKYVKDVEYECAKAYGLLEDQ
ncbi:hypothetical protein Tco_0250561 [Tanacetum coccineum]